MRGTPQSWPRPLAAFLLGRTALMRPCLEYKLKACRVLGQRHFQQTESWWEETQINLGREGGSSRKGEQLGRELPRAALASFVFASPVPLHVCKGEGSGEKESGISEIGQVIASLNWMYTIRKESNKNGKLMTSLVIQRLRLRAAPAGVPSLIPGQGTRSRMPQLRVHMLQLRPGTTK